MYRDKNKPPQTPHDTQFWQYAARLKRDNFQTIVHSLAWHSLPAYSYLIELLESNTPLERITILLWRDHYLVAKKLEKLGYGTLSPSSLRTFREKYYKANNFSSPIVERLKVEKQIQMLVMNTKKLEMILQKIEPVEKRVSITEIGQNMRVEIFDTLSYPQTPIPIVVKVSDKSVYS